MNNQLMQCDDRKLAALLAAEESGEGNDPWIDHVEDCERCQTRLRVLAANDDDWQKASRVLSMADGDEWPDLSPVDDRPVVWNESMVKQLLDPPTHPEMLGRLGRYEIERLIGSGGMGIVSKAHDTELNRPVAIKLLAPYLAGNGSARKRFAREARAAAGVVDDHVVPIHNVDSESEPPYLVMQYVAGGSLQEKLDRDGPLDVAEVLRIGLQTAKGLAAAHAQGLIHRDVKPSNILLDEGVERALLTDFGLARAENDACLTRSGFHPGTPHYMSPEQVRGESIDARSDLFGLGCVMYALCTGHPPFRAETSYAVLRRTTDDEPRSIRELNSDVPEWLEAIVMKLLSKSPDDRFGSAAEVAELLEACLAHVQQPTVVPLPAKACSYARQSVDRSSKTTLPFGDSSYDEKANPEPATTSRSQPPFKKLLIALAFAVPLLLAGILIVLEFNKGTLTIESEADNVPVRVMQGDEVVEKMTVSRSGKSIRIAAGQYVIEIGGEIDGLMVKDETVSVRRGGREVVRIVKRPRQKNVEQRAPATPMAELRRLQGVWMMNTCDSATEGFGDKLAVVRDWRWDFRGKEIIWARSHGKVWKMSFTIDPTKTPKEIDLTYLDGPFKGKKSLGRYRWGGIDGKTLWISVQDPGVDVPRPKSVGMRSGETSLMLLDRPNADQELASLQGEWKLEVFYTDTLPKPTGNYVGSRWVIQGNEMSWTGPDSKQIKMSFTIDPTKLPSEIDATFLSGPHKGEKCLGIYERRGSTLLLCLADPGPQVPRPKNVAYETLAGKTMIVLTPTAHADDASKEHRRSLRKNTDKASDNHQPANTSTRLLPQGEWQLLSNTLNGNATELGKSTATIAGDRVAIQSPALEGGKADTEFRYVLNGNHIDLLCTDRRTGKDFTLLGIYQSQRDRLWIAYHDAAQNPRRPKSAKTDTPEADVVYMEFRRISRATDDNDRTVADPADNAHATLPVYKRKTLAQWLSGLKDRDSLTPVEQQAIDTLVDDTPKEQIRELFNEWSALVKRERDVIRLAIGVYVVCSLVAEDDSEKALDVVVTIIRRAPNDVPVTGNNPKTALQYVYLALKKLDADAVRARMFKEVAEGTSNSRLFALHHWNLNEGDPFAEPTPIQALIAASSDKHELVRKLAVTQLGQFYSKDQRALKRIGELLEDSNSAVSRIAVRELARLDPHSDKLLSALREWAVASHVAVQHNAVAWLLNIAASENKDALDVLVQLLDDMAWGNRLVDSDLESKRVPWTYFMYSPRETPRVRAIQGLGKLGQKAAPAMAVLNKQLKHEDEKVQAEAAKAIALVNEPQEKKAEDQSQSEGEFPEADPHQVAVNPLKGMNGKVPLTSAQISQLFEQVLNRKPTAVEVSRTFEIIIAAIIGDRRFRERARLSAWMEDGEAEAMRPFDETDEVIKELTEKKGEDRPQTTDEPLSVDPLKGINGKVPLTSDHISQLFEHNLDRKPTTAELFKSFEVIVAALIDDPALYERARLSSWIDGGKAEARRPINETDEGIEEPTQKKDKDRSPTTDTPIAIDPRKGINGQVPLTSNQISHLFERTFNRKPTTAEVFKNLETIVAELVDDPKLRYREQLRDWIKAAAEDEKRPFDAFAEEQIGDLPVPFLGDEIGKPQTPEDNHVLRLAIDFGGDLTSKGIIRAYERALERKPTDAEITATLEWLIENLITDEHFHKQVGKGLFGGDWKAGMLDKHWDKSFKRLVEETNRTGATGKPDAKPQKGGDDSAKTQTPQDNRVVGSLDPATTHGDGMKFGESREFGEKELARLAEAHSKLDMSTQRCTDCHSAMPDSMKFRVAEKLLLHAWSRPPNRHSAEVDMQPKPELDGEVDAAVRQYPAADICVIVPRHSSAAKEMLRNGATLLLLVDARALTKAGGADLDSPAWRTIRLQLEKSVSRFRGDQRLHARLFFENDVYDAGLTAQLKKEFRKRFADIDLYIVCIDQQIQNDDTTWEQYVAGITSTELPKNKSVLPQIKHEGKAHHSENNDQAWSIQNFYHWVSNFRANHKPKWFSKDYYQWVDSRRGPPSL